jgi:hypothetical protein
MIVQYLDIGVFGSGDTPDRLLLGKVSMPFTELPDFIIQDAVDPWLGKITYIHRIVVPFILEKGIQILCKPGGCMQA